MSTTLTLQQQIEREAQARLRNDMGPAGFATLLNNPGLPSPSATPETPPAAAPVEMPPAEQIDPALPARKKPEEIDAELGLPPAETGLTAPPADDAGTWDILSAAWRKETVNTDAWNNTASRRRALVEEMWEIMDEGGKRRVWENRVRNGWASMEELVAAEAGRQAALSPDVARVWAGYPLSIEDFNRQIDAGRQADLEEANSVLDQPGGGFAEFVGTAARAMTDETSLILLPFGVSGSAWRMIAGEAVLGAVGEAAVLPKEYRVAEELGLPDPDALNRIAMGAVFGGGLSAAVIGLGKGARALIARAEARRASLSETLPDGVDRIDHDHAVEAAEAELRGDQTVQERLGGGVAGGARAEAPPKGTLGDILDEPKPGILPDAGAGGLVDAAEWQPIRGGIFAGESGGDYNALFGYSNRKGGQFSGVKLTEMTVDQAIAFSDPSGPYGQWVKGKIGRVATPMGAYQIVGTTLRAAKKGLGLKGDEVMTPELQELLGQWIYLQQGTGAWEGYRGPRADYVPGSVDGPAPDMGPTTRGYTGQGQVTVGDDMRIDVDYEVVDYRSLIRASGDLQPRDRSRINSDEWVATTAARLDPAQLMPSPTADRGAPIVGPDNVIESGNGRSMAIARAYERHPDRAQAYRGAIEAAGYQIPDGVDQPVLIARRRTELSPDQRRQLVVDAQDSGVAQMTPTEVARATARNLGSSILARLDPAAPLASDANGAFVRSALATLPRSARNAMFDPSGALNALGQRQLREALFARAWPDPDILARYTEGAPAELKTLIEALETAAPNWAALRADIEAGLVTPDMDIGPYVLDAMRLIGAAREVAAAEQARRAIVPKAQRTPYSVSDAIKELLDEVDLIQGPVAPLTAALVRKMWPNGRAAPADDVAAFLARYADEARTAGRAGGMFDTPGPRDVLRTIDPDTFADLPEDLGQARGFAIRATSEAPAEAVATLPDQGFDAGARSPEAEAVHDDIAAELRGPSDATSPTIAETLADLLPEQYVRAAAAAQPFDTFDQLYDFATAAQGRLDQAGDEIAAKLGVDWRNPGLKDRATAEKKVTRKGYDSPRRLIDISRGGFVVRSLADADAVADELAARFDIIDEGWVRTPLGYIDRKLVIIHSDGMLSEVQLWTETMFKAKKIGTDAYSKWRGLPKDAPEAKRLEAQQKETYAAAAGDLSAISFSTGGTSSEPKLRANIRSNASAEPTTPAVWATSKASTDDQSAPSVVLATANRDPSASRNSSAGRQSQLQNASSFMGEVLPGDTFNMGARAAPVNTNAPADLSPIDTAALADLQAGRDLARARSELAEFADVEIDLPDGTTARAGDILDDLDSDRAADAVLQACGITQGGSQ